MTIDFVKLANPGLKSLMPYKPGKPVSEVKRELGLNNIVKICSNESFLGASPKVNLTAIADFDLARYPDASAYSLKNALAQFYDIEPNKILLGNGSEEAINLLLRAFLSNNDSIIIPEYSFVAYALAAKSLNAKIITSQTNNYVNDLDDILAKIEPSTKIIALANPNNPTGPYVNKTTLSNFLAKVPKNIIVLLDEAYYEFAKVIPDYPNGIDFINDYPNVVVTRTFSKAYGLAGIRAGYLIANAAIVDLLNRIRLPFNMNTIAQSASEIALKDQEFLTTVISQTMANKQYFETELLARKIEFIPSVAGFVTIKTSLDGRELFQKVLEQGVIIRHLFYYNLPNHVRITIGSKEDLTSCLSALDFVLGSKHG